MPSWIALLIRTASLFFLCLIIIRILGKRHPLKTTAFTFISYVVLAVISALMIANIIENYVFGVIALITWVILFITVDYAAMKSKAVHDLVYGHESVLVQGGKVMEENLSKERLTGEELLRALRTKNIFSMADVEFAIMEPTGDINVLLKSDKKPSTPHDFEQKVAPQGPPQTVILDGNIILESLCNLGLNEAWLQNQLDNLEVGLNNVFIGQVNSSGELYVDLFDDLKTPPQSQVRELIYANLEKCQADLTSFAIETEDEAAKNLYSKDAKELKELMDKLRPYLLR
jgi:uncharacterized membrane protein YcaP (DUF421 family)